MTPQTGQLFVLGCVLGLGLWTIVTSLPRFTRPRLVDQLAPHLIDISEAARLHTTRPGSEPLPVIGTLLQPLIHRTHRILNEFLGGEQATRRRLRQANTGLTIERFRMQQAAAAVAGAAVGVIVAGVVVSRTPNSWNVLVAAPLTFALGGVALREFALRRQAANRMRRIASEFPTVLEFMTLALAAGEGVFDAMRRIASLNHSELAREFEGAINQMHAGVPAAEAIRSFAEALSFVPLERTSDHLITAMERGAPLAEVLQAQAGDARVLEKRELMDRAGRNEIRMMFPLVLLILPITVLFAVFPSFFVLTNTF